MRSLRRRLLGAGIFGVLLASVSAAWLLGEAFERAGQRAFDRRLGEDLDHLIAQAEFDPVARPRLVREPADERYDMIFSGWYWAVALADGTRTSRSMWDEQALDPALEASNSKRSFSLAPGPRGQQLRVAAQRVAYAGSTHSPAFAVAGDLTPLQVEVSEFRWFTAVAVALIALALVAAMGWQVAFGLRPLRRVRETLVRLQAGDEVRFDTDSLPLEVAPLSAQVNELLDEHARRVQRARHAAQDLAHALKTPLAALLLESSSREDSYAQRVSVLGRRMQQAIERQLAGTFAADSRQRTPVGEVVAALSALLSRVHDGRVTIKTSVPAALIFPGSREDLEEMLGNLLDNACKWGRACVEVAARQCGDMLVIDVDDDGPGMDASQGEHALRRGIRLDERVAGTGLGLAIVQDVAAGYAGQVALTVSPLGGLRVTLSVKGARAEATHRVE